MKRVQEPPDRLFWDNCLWYFLLGLEGDLEREADKRGTLEQALTSVEMGGVGLVFSPCLFADANKDVPLERFVASVKSLEEAGYLTVLHPTADWSGIAALRAAMRQDLRQHPQAFSNLKKPSVGLGDTVVVYAAIRTGCDALWTWDPTLLAFSERPSVRGLTIEEPRALVAQGRLLLD